MAYSFNLTESAGEFSIELVGTASYDSEDSDWACDESFRPDADTVILPNSIVSDQWELCLTKVRKALADYLDSGRPGAVELRSKVAVAVGFVDGELEIIYKKP
jgi:CRISPR/Cas system-associated protein Csx1